MSGRKINIIAKSYQTIMIINGYPVENKTTGHYNSYMGKREDKKQLIIETGLSVIAAKGYNGTGVKEIVDSAGIPKGSFYNYFDSKETFAVEALEYAFAESESRMKKQLLRSQNDQEAYQRLMSFFEEGKTCAQQQGYKTGCIVGNLCQEMADSSELIRRKANQLFKRQAKIMATCIQEAQQHGDINPELDPEMLAEYLFNAWEGALMRIKASQCDNAINIFLQLLPKLLK